MGKGNTLSSLPSLISFSKCEKHLEAIAGKKTQSRQHLLAWCRMAASLGLAEDTTVELHHTGLQFVVQSTHVVDCLQWPERLDK